MAQVNLGHVVGPGVPTGGTAGQVLKKNGSTNFDASWTTLNSGNIPISASDNTTVQQSLAAVKSDMGIVEDGNTATHTIAAGQYVIWKGALYTASAAIPSGTTLSTSNLTAVSDGGLNSLNGKLEKIATTLTNSGLTAGLYALVLRDDSVSSRSFLVTGWIPATGTINCSTIVQNSANTFWIRCAIGFVSGVLTIDSAKYGQINTSGLGSDATISIVSIRKII